MENSILKLSLEYREIADLVNGNDWPRNASLKITYLQIIIDYKINFNIYHTMYSTILYINTILFSTLTVRKNINTNVCA